MAWYLDTSAFLKLAVREEHSTQLRRWVEEEEEHGPLWSCDLLHTEAIRAARRVGPAALAAVRDLLDRIAIVALTPETFARAGELDPAVMRSLDAVHLAAALRLGEDLDGVVTYDDRMAEAARALGIPVLSP
jgi:predicted nucleic acid-binding protein